MQRSASLSVPGNDSGTYDLSAIANVTQLAPEWKRLARVRCGTYVRLRTMGDSNSQHHPITAPHIKTASGLRRTLQLDLAIDQFAARAGPMSACFAVVPWPPAI